MLQGLTQAGIGAVSNEQLIELAGRYRFQAVDLDALSLVEAHGIEGARQLLAKHGVVLGTIGLPVEWRGTEEQFLQGLEKLPRAAAAAKALGCASCCTYILPSTDEKPAHFMAIATRRLRVCAQILGAYGVRLGLEFVGPHHLRTAWKHPFIWSMEETLDWIEAIGESNVGLLLDAIHWYTNHGTVQDIERLRPEQIVHVHINDAPDIPVEEVLDNGRIYPGEGVIDLIGFLQALDKIGYKGAVSQEILTAVPLAETIEERLDRSRAGYDKLYAAAGLQ
ncbi:sugar phosphate isomerase/epimerase family protein [Paenibacillus sp. GCM10027626]|uniref:sugar phosphate isomerase/epimerase family protein n=1 Tax=Paenibacillus sp. GCM10027626 TaxID=3273411 RepID=UPI00363619C4